MKITILLVAFFMGFTQSLFAAEKQIPKLEVVIETMEIEKLNISLDDSLNGYVVTPKMKCQITPDTRAFNKDTAVPLIEARNQKGKSALVSCVVKTRIVTEIKWPM